MAISRSEFPRTVVELSPIKTPFGTLRSGEAAAYGDKYSVQARLTSGGEAAV